MAYRLETNLSFEEREDFADSDEITGWRSIKTYSVWTEKYIPMFGLKRHCIDYSVFLWFYGNIRISAAPELRRLFEGSVIKLTFPLHVRRLFESDAY